MGVQLTLAAMGCRPGEGIELDPNGVMDNNTRLAVEHFWQEVAAGSFSVVGFNLLIFALMAGDFADDLAMIGIVNGKVREALNNFLALGDQPPVLETK